MSRPWTKLTGNRCMCATCRRLFSSTSAFDLHRTPEGCVDPATLVTKDGVPKLVPKPAPIWKNEVIWSWPGERPTENTPLKPWVSISPGRSGEEGVLIPTS